MRAALRQSPRSRARAERVPDEAKAACASAAGTELRPGFALAAEKRAKLGDDTRLLGGEVAGFARIGVVIVQLQIGSVGGCCGLLPFDQPVASGSHGPPDQRT